jgi:hypothetical protein
MVMAVDSASNAAKLLEVVTNGFHRDCIVYGGSDRVTRSTTIHQSVGAGRPGNASSEAGAVAFKEVSCLEGDAKE